MKLSMITPLACFLAAATCLLLPVSFAQARMVTQIVPTLTVTEEYTDNYFQTGTDPFEEWTTSYELGFSVGFLNKRSQIYLEYNPEYTDYKNLNERNGLDHNASLSAAYQVTRHTSAKADISYDGHDGNNTGESWEHSASASVDSQLTKTVKTSLATTIQTALTSSSEPESTRSTRRIMSVAPSVRRLVLRIILGQIFLTKQIIIKIQTQMNMKAMSPAPF